MNTFSQPLVSLKNAIYISKKLLFYCLITIPLTFCCLLIIGWGNMKFSAETLAQLIIFPLLTYIAAVVLVGFIVLWCLSVFFWCRMARNYLALYFHPSENYRILTWKRILPFYGMRAEDLSPQGLVHRKLVSDGFFGFLTCIAIICVFALVYHGVILWSS